MNVVTRFETIAGIRAFVAEPEGAASRPALLFYSDIFQLTPPHLGLATRFAAHGYRVVAPEIYRGIEPPGVVLDFERDRERALADSARVRVEDADADRDALIGALSARAERVFVAGNCFGGHLAFRAAYDRRVTAVACFYPTTVHADRLGASEHVDTLTRAAELHAKLLLVWGARDPHIPAEGRARIEETLRRAGARFETHTFDAEHAFMRDEGPRFDPVATDAALAATFAFFGL